MKKFGFTLAEVLITLGIIGVVAALTAPALVLSSKNEANGAKLAVTVSNLENAFTTAIVQEGVNNFEQTSIWAANDADTSMGGQLGKYMHVSGVKNVNIIQYYGDSDTSTNLDDDPHGKNGPYDINGKAIGVKTLFGNSRPILTKNGSTLFIMKTKDQNYNGTTTETKIRNAGGSLIHKLGLVSIDINGLTKPNKLGRDIFLFSIGDQGILFPIGGVDNAIYQGKGTYKVANHWSGHGDWSCITDADLDKKPDGSGCAGRVVEEGYKINY